MFVLPKWKLSLFLLILIIIVMQKTGIFPFESECMFCVEESGGLQIMMN